MNNNPVIDHGNGIYSIELTDQTEYQDVLRKVNAFTRFRTEYPDRIIETSEVANGQNATDHLIIVTSV